MILKINNGRGDLNLESMDIVIYTVSIDYLIKPLAVLKECFRLVKHGVFNV